MNIQATQNILPRAVDNSTAIPAHDTMDVKKSENVESMRGADVKVIEQSYDKATQLLQSISSDKLTEEVIRKMPPDDFLKLQSLLDNIISGSIHKEA